MNQQVNAMQESIKIALDAADAAHHPSMKASEKQHVCSIV